MKDEEPAYLARNPMNFLISCFTSAKCCQSMISGDGKGKIKASLSFYPDHPVILSQTSTLRTLTPHYWGRKKRRARCLAASVVSCFARISSTRSLSEQSSEAMSVRR